MTRAWLWWSTGKDSAWALHVLRERGVPEVTGLVTTVTPTFGRVAIHGTRMALLEAQAEACALPLRTIELPHPCSNAQYEAAVRPLLDEAVREGVGHMAFGDLFLADVRAYRERMLESTPLEPIFPLWGGDTAGLAAAMLDAGMEARITCLDPERLDPSLAGRRWDGMFLEGLPETVDPCGENGEFHTCVVDGPMFARPLDVRVGEVVRRDGFVYADILLSDGG